MIRAFTYLALWMNEFGLKSTDYEIVIRPKHADAYHRLRGALHKDDVHLHFYKPAVAPPTEGSIAGIPFRIVRVPI